jgi:hypothetical protein
MTCSRGSVNENVANDEGARAGEIAQCFDRALGLALLIQRDADDQKDEAEQHQSLLPVAEQEVDGSAPEKQRRHRLANYVQQSAQKRSIIGRQHWKSRANSGDACIRRKCANRSWPSDPGAHRAANLFCRVAAPLAPEAHAIEREEDACSML